MPEPCARPHQPVGDLGDRAVAAGRDHHRRAALHRLARQYLGMPGAMRLRQVEPDSVGHQHI